MAASRMFGKGATGSPAATLRPLLLTVECIAFYREGLLTHRPGPRPMACAGWVVLQQSFLCAGMEHSSSVMLLQQRQFRRRQMEWGQRPRRYAVDVNELAVMQSARLQDGEVVLWGDGDVF